MARKYVVVFEDWVFTRSTERIYTHLVIVKYPTGWEAAHWCGRLDLAMKQAGKYTTGLVKILEVPQV